MWTSRRTRCGLLLIERRTEIDWALCAQTGRMFREIKNKKMKNSYFKTGMNKKTLSIFSRVYILSRYFLDTIWQIAYSFRRKVRTLLLKSIEQPLAEPRQTRSSNDWESQFETHHRTRIRFHWTRQTAIVLATKRIYSANQAMIMNNIRTNTHSSAAYYEGTLWGRIMTILWPYACVRQRSIERWDNSLWCS